MGLTLDENHADKRVIMLKNRELSQLDYGMPHLATGDQRLESNHSEDYFNLQATSYLPQSNSTCMKQEYVS